MSFKRSRFIGFILLSVFVLGVLLLSRKDAAVSVRSAGTDVASTVLTPAEILSREFQALVYFHRNYWMSRNLIRENDALRATLSQQAEILRENESLRELLDLSKRVSYQTLAAMVIGRDFNVFRSYLILDKGQLGGVHRYAPVLTASGLVGKVIEVGQFSSKVILVNDPDLSVPAMNQRTREHGLVSGTLDGQCKLRFLDLDSEVKENDLIVTSGLNLSYPEGIVIGTVRMVGVESSGFGKFAILEPAVRAGQLEEVLVIKTSAS